MIVNLNREALVIFKRIVGCTEQGVRNPPMIFRGVFIYMDGLSNTLLVSC